MMNDTNIGILTNIEEIQKENEIIRTNEINLRLKALKNNDTYYLENRWDKHFTLGGQI